MLIVVCVCGLASWHVYTTGVGNEFQAINTVENRTMTRDFDRGKKALKRKAHRLKMIFAPSETEFGRLNTEKKKYRNG